MSGLGRCAIGTLAFVAAIASACSSPQRPPPPRGICQLDQPRPDAGVRRADAGTRSIAVRSLRAEQWFALLLPGYDRTTGAVAAPTRDCAGNTLRWQEPERTCAEPPADTEMLPSRPLVEDDLVIQRAPGNFRIVWIAVDRYSNGEAVGPVALAEFTDSSVAIRKIGVLRALPRRTRIHMEDLGSGKILIAEGERCTNEQDPTTCRRSARVMTVQGDRFVAEPLTRANGECISPARFDLGREQTVILDSGWARRFELNSSLTFGTQITVHEQVVVKDSDPRLPAIPPRVFRRVDADRVVRLVNGRLQTEDLSLWTRVAEAQASVAGGHRESDAADAGAAPATPPQ